MSGLEFENFCAQQFAKSKRFKTVETTPPSGDFGADIVAVDKEGVQWVFSARDMLKDSIILPYRKLKEQSPTTTLTELE